MCHHGFEVKGEKGHSQFTTIINKISKNSKLNMIQKGVLEPF